jgi:hypothetical protein
MERDRAAKVVRVHVGVATQYLLAEALEPLVATLDR